MIESSVKSTILIGGELNDLRETRPVINPANIEEVIGEVSMGKNKDVSKAIEVAEKTYKTWSITSREKRSRLANQAAKKLKPRVEELTSLFVRESGKTLIEAKVDIQRSIDVLEQTPKTLNNWYEGLDLSNEKQHVKIMHRPRGVTTIITPWNSPVILTIKRVIPAILTGNTVVVKPATNCPLTITEFLKVVAGVFPPGVINIVTGSGNEIGEALVSDKKIKTISFVGGTETGKNIMEKASSTLKKVHLELGGNDPAIILEDVLLNKENIKKLKYGIIRNAGQVCSAIKRIYVHENRYDELVKKLGNAFNEVIVGEGIHPDSTMGSINNFDQLNYIKELIKDTEDNGGVVSYHGIKLNEEKWDKGHFMLPALVTNVSQDSRIVQEEQFGPVIPILPFKDIKTVIEQANDTIYGLRASIWTKDIQKATNLSQYIEAGAVFYNNHTVFANLNIDFPGVKESGIGRETSNSGFEHFTDSYGFVN